MEQFSEQLEVARRLTRISHEYTFRVVLVRVLAYGLAIAIVVLVVPGVTGTTDSVLLGALWAGVVYGLLNGIVKPLFGMLLMRFIVQTYGLVMVIINIAIFGLLAWLTGIIEVDSVLAAVLAGIGLGIVVFLLEGVLGLTRPVYAPPGESE